MPTEDIEEIFMSANVSRLVVQNLQKSFKNAKSLKASPSKSKAAKSSDCSGPTVRVKPPAST